ncbi:MAG: hypothetical protein ACKO8Z_16875 [Prosthecobacter sp.]
MSLDLDLELPFDPTPPFPAPSMSADQYLEFIEFNRKVLIENGQLEKMLAAKPPPVDKMFTMD